MKKAVLLFYLYISVTLPNSDAQVLHSVSGEVASGNYTYYSLMYDGPISLKLYSTYGDADLYVSQFVSKPSFEPENYCLQSSTCGFDVVHIPKSFKRPVGIAVYGHPSHAVSEYYLEVVYRQKKEVYVFEEEDLNTVEDTQKEFEDDFGDEKDTDSRGDIKTNSEDEVDRDDEDSEGGFLSALLWTFINILVEVLFL